MTKKPKIVLSLIGLIAFGVIAADAGLEQFNAQKTEVQNNKPDRATNTNGTTSVGVGTGEHWESNIQNQLNSYSPDTSELEARLRNEFNAAISDTNANVENKHYTTSQSLSTLQSSTNAKINTINTDISALEAKVAELEALVGSGGSGGWEVIYEGAGTNLLEVPGEWSDFKATFYLEEAYSGAKKTSSVTGTFNQNMGRTATRTVSNCSASSSVSFTMDGSISIPTSGPTITQSCTYECGDGKSCTQKVSARLVNLKLLKLEVYR